MVFMMVFNIVFSVKKPTKGGVLESKQGHLGVFRLLGQQSRTAHFLKTGLFKVLVVLLCVFTSLS